MDQENYPVESDVSNESSSSSQSDAQLSARKSKTRYTLLFKLKVINEYHKCKNVDNCSRLFGIDRRVISKWLKNEKEIRKTQNRRTRTTCHIKVDKCYFPELGKQLY
ncbi:unnamed protein product [Brachionus calyciflorus]|uniref:Brinker DNA-binding domain-containing protein n=1 Tax=Brachionus calyciflorus TaxID=104777 RepID=A0A814KPT4_9BILA|nr:unnamed protein product [Brachionus calyciflorus]